MRQEILQKSKIEQKLSIAEKIRAKSDPNFTKEQRLQFRKQKIDEALKEMLPHK